MSRTDAHRPWRVQVTDPAVIRNCRASHYHWIYEDPYTEHREGSRFGIRKYHVVRSAPCDLWTAGGLGRCGWLPNSNTCGCRMCTAHYELRAERRRGRHQTRMACRETLKEYFRPR